jgi:hypothetical protein
MRNELPCSPLAEDFLYDLHFASFNASLSNEGEEAETKITKASIKKKGSTLNLPAAGGFNGRC